MSRFWVFYCLVQKPGTKFVPGLGAIVPQREVVIDNLPVRIHLMIEMIFEDRPCAMRILIPFSRKPFIHLPNSSSSEASGTTQVEQAVELTGEWERQVSMGLEPFSLN